MKMFALVTNQGTAAEETALCLTCATPTRKKKYEEEAESDVSIIDGWQDVTENDALGCNECGKRA
jgi:uncharacterized protein with PIN domain